MPEDSDLLTFLPAYWGYAFAIASGFYGAITWFGKQHLSQGAKDSLALWLMGAQEGRWAHHFCNLFDAVFGARHWSWRCFLRSSIASVIAVLLLYLLLAEILGVMGSRAFGDLSLWQAVTFGAAINIIPDYLSLFETRWLLQRFERVRSVLGQLAVLLADALFTGAIIWLGINAFQWLRGETILTAIEMLALFSVFSLFFYSTFLTSIWAWLYCLSTWFMRLFTRTWLKRLLDVEHKPVRQVALVGAILLFLGALALTPALKTDERRQASAFDDMLCTYFPADACSHVARLTADEKVELAYLAKACEGGEIERCMVTGREYFRGDDAKAAQLFRRACDGNVAAGCRLLGWMYENGRGVAQDDVEAVEFYGRACSGKATAGCNDLGMMYANGRAVARDDAKAASLYEQACLGGEPLGCSNLGLMYQEGRGVDQNDAEAVDIYEFACSEGSPAGCSNLGMMYQDGRGVTRDDARARSLYERACNAGHAISCNNLGVMYQDGRGVAQDYTKAQTLFQKACELGLEVAGCAVFKRSSGRP